MNTLTATIEFDFKGESYALSSEIEVDRIISHEDFYKFIYIDIVQNNNIGLHTYELEIIMDQNIIFSDANGYVEGCIANGKLDLVKLKENQRKSECLSKIKVIAEQFKSNNDITAALMDAYLLGKKSI